MAIFTAPPVVVGHRGAPRGAPENTLAAFQAAHDQGAAWVELDVRRTRDGRLAVVHDPTIDGQPVVDLDAGDLAAQGIATLDTLLPRLPAGLGLDIELKNLPGEPDFDEDQRLAVLTAEALAPVIGTRPLVASSFNPLALQALRAALPDLALGLLTVPTLALRDGIALAEQFGVDAIFPHLTAGDLDAASVGQAHARGLAVMVWTVDDPTEAVRLADTGVDALCTNEPATIVQALQAAGLLRR